LARFGGEKIILGADARNEKVAISGWQEETQVSVYQFVSDFFEKGIRYVISTDVAKDGLLQGPSFELYQNLQNQIPGLKIIASGGVAEMSDILALDEMNIFGVIVGKAIYEGRISLNEIQKFNLQ
jgi:phosphoribosylformimino-5-aminoimidazole carboxamide ribotide isomerase